MKKQTTGRDHLGAFALAKEVYGDGAADEGVKE